MRLAISHETVYRYENPVKHSTQYLRLTPHSSHSQRIIDWELELPVPAVKSMDAYGNILHVLTLDYPHQEIRIRAKGLVETSSANDTDHDSLAPMPFLRHTDLTRPDSALRIFAEHFRRLRWLACRAHPARLAAGLRAAPDGTCSAPDQQSESTLIPYPITRHDLLRCHEPAGRPAVCI
jgi:transglutaminase-like putative cysteine protease